MYICIIPRHLGLYTNNAANNTCGHKMSIGIMHAQSLCCVHPSRLGLFDVHCTRSILGNMGRCFACPPAAPAGCGQRDVGWCLKGGCCRRRVFVHKSPALDSNEPGLGVPSWQKHVAPAFGTTTFRKRVVLPVANTIARAMLWSQSPPHARPAAIPADATAARTRPHASGSQAPFALSL